MDSEPLLTRQYHRERAFGVARQPRALKRETQSFTRFTGGGWFKQTAESAGVTQATARRLLREGMEAEGLDARSFAALGESRQRALLRGIIKKEYADEELASAVVAWTEPNIASLIRKHQQQSLPARTTRTDASQIGSLSGRVERYITVTPKYEGEITRGINVPETVAKSFTPYTIIDQMGTSSWTTDPGRSLEYATSGNSVPVIFRSQTKRGVSIRDLSQHPEEEEILQSLSVRWVVTRIGSEGGILYIDCREVRK